MIKIFIVDDHNIVRKGLVKLLENTGNIKIIGEAANNKELQQADLHKTDILILDIGLPDKSGFDILKEIKVKYPKLNVLILSMYPEDQYAIRLIKSGASGFVSKDSAPDELLDAIQKVYQGETYVSHKLAKHLIDYIDSKDHNPLHFQLSDREFEVFIKFAGGTAIKEIAEELKISPKTVSTYKLRVQQKLSLKTNVDFALYAKQHNLF